MHRDVTYVATALQARTRASCCKQSASSELLTAIRDVMAGRTYITPRLAERFAQMSSESAADNQADLPTLTLRQREVLQLFAEGRSAKQVAAALHISPRTVEKHKEHIMAVLQVTTMAEVVQYAVDTASSPTEPAAFFLTVARRGTTKLAPIPCGLLVRPTPPHNSGRGRALAGGLPLPGGQASPYVDLRNFIGLRSFAYCQRRIGPENQGVTEDSLTRKVVFDERAFAPEARTCGMVADTNLHMLRGVHTLLESLFDTTVMVSDERSLLETAANFRQDACFVDLLFPVTAEANVILLIRKRFPSLPVVVLSLYDEPSVADESLSRGAMAFVLKAHRFSGPRSGRRSDPAGGDLCLSIRAIAAPRAAWRWRRGQSTRIRRMNRDKAIGQASRNISSNERRAGMPTQVSCINPTKTSNRSGKMELPQLDPIKNGSQSPPPGTGTAFTP